MSSVQAPGPGGSKTRGAVDTAGRIAGGDSHTSSAGHPVALANASDRRAFGGKAAALATALRAGLPVPEGVAADWQLVERVAGGDRGAAAALTAAAAHLGPSLAVRSSALDEDSAGASFAGQHQSLLGVEPDQVAAAAAAVAGSGDSASAQAYRQRVGVVGRPQVAVVVQRLLDADVAGVLFWPHPVTGADEIVIEAAWGLGEAVVAGVVAPDLYRLSSHGNVLERRAGVKDVSVEPGAGGGTATRPVPAERARALCLDDARLGALHALAVSCTRVFAGSQDLEWAFAAGRLWLLQRRPLTATPGPPAA